ncbi:anthranilate synthase component II [Caldithrix abyssi]
MLLFIDNYDSFTYNLVDYFGQLADEIRVFRNDAISLEEIEALQAEGIVISPGPGTPEQSGVSLEVVKRLGKKIPVLGICLGHQVIGQIYGAKVIRADEPVHGKVSEILHKGDLLFEGIPSPFQATRYHSLVVEWDSLPEELEVIAHTSDQIIMAMRHRRFPVVGIQFHPESILTRDGMKMLSNWYRSIKKVEEAI